MIFRTISPSTVGKIKSQPQNHSLLSPGRRSKTAWYSYEPLSGTKSGELTHCAHNGAHT